MRILFYILFGYLSGSILYGYWIPKLFWGVDTQKEGEDGNPGTTNAFLHAGTFCGIMVLLGDLLKGAIPVHLAVKGIRYEDWAFSLILAAPVLGHAWPLFGRFGKGGKAIAVSFGVLLGLCPLWTPVLALAACFLFFSLVVVIEPHCVRTAVTFLVWMIAAVRFGHLSALRMGAVLISGVVIHKHLPEIRRLKREQMSFAIGRSHL